MVLAAFVAALGVIQCADGTTMNSSQTHACVTPDTSSYAFDFTDVYTLNRKMPQGCTCKNNLKSDSECTVRGSGRRQRARGMP